VKREAPGQSISQPVMSMMCVAWTIAMSLALVGCREKSEVSEYESEAEHPRCYIPCAKTSPKGSASMPLAANESSACHVITTANTSVAIKELSAELTKCVDAGELTNERALQLLETHLGSASFSDAFSGLSELMTSSDVEGRIAALNVLAILKGEWSATVDMADDVDGDIAVQKIAAAETEISADEESDAARNLESVTSEDDDVEQRAVYAMMTLGLQDESSSVRDAAYETLLALPQEERSALALQLMGNDDVALKERLLSSCAGDDSEFARSVNFHGLDAQEPSVRTLADANVKSLVGRSFATSDEAFAWYEQSISVGE